MGKLTRKLANRAKALVREAYEKIETRVLVAQGRKAVRAKVRKTAQVTGKAAKAGLVAGAVTAAGVVAREVRKRKRG